MFIAVILILITTCLFISYALKEGKKADIRTNNYAEAVSLYKGRFIGNSIAAAVLILVPVLVITLNKNPGFLSFLFLMGCSIAFQILLVGAIRSLVLWRRCSNMEEQEYSRMRKELIREKKEEDFNAANRGSLMTFMEKCPNCPRCGSSDTTTSGDFKANMAAVTIMRASRYAYIKKEFKCNSCGHIWSPVFQPGEDEEDIAPNNHLQDVDQQEVANVPPTSSDDHFGLKAQRLKEMKSLFDAGILTQEEFDEQKNRILND